MKDQRLEAEARAFLASVKELVEGLPPELVEVVKRDVSELGELLARLTRYYELISNVDFTSGERVAVAVVAYLLATSFISLTTEFAARGVPADAAATMALLAIANPSFAETLAIPLKAYELVVREQTEEMKKE